MHFLSIFGITGGEVVYQRFHFKAPDGDFKDLRKGVESIS